MVNTDENRAARFRPQAYDNYLSAVPLDFRAGGEEDRNDSGVFGVTECRVLVVDDNPTVLQLLAEMFALSGYPVTKACGPEKAISLLKESHFHLILTDYNMPMLNGYHLACRVKLKAPRSRVVIMTGGYHDEMDWLLSCSKIDGLLLKPVAICDLSRLISTLALPNGFSRYAGEKRSYPCATS